MFLPKTYATAGATPVAGTPPEGFSGWAAGRDVGLFPLKSYNRCGEPSGGLAGTARQMYQGGWAQEVASLLRKTPEIAD